MWLFFLFPPNSLGLPLGVSLVVTSEQVDTKGTLPSGLEDFKPPRKRLLDRMLLHGAAQSQPSGRALPSLIPGPRDCSGAFFRAACNLNPAVALLGRAISEQAKGIAARRALMPAFVLNRRSAMLAALQELSEVLAPFRSRWIAAIPANSPAAGLNFPLIYFLTVHFAYGDGEFAKDLAHGMPIAGFVPAVGTLTPRYRSAVTTLERWRAGLPARNRVILERVKASHGSALAVLGRHAGGG